MTLYEVHLTTTASAYVRVEADSLDEAIDEAHERTPNDVCAQCSGWGSDNSLELAGDWEEAEIYVDGKQVGIDGEVTA